MLTLVQIPRPEASSAGTTSLAAEYVAFDRRRRSRRQYQKAFGGMAIIAALGALFGQVDAEEAAIVDFLLLTPVLALASIEVFHWQRLVRRLDRARVHVQAVKKS